MRLPAPSTASAAAKLFAQPIAISAALLCLGVMCVAAFQSFDRAPGRLALRTAPLDHISLITATDGLTNIVWTAGCGKAKDKLVRLAVPAARVGVSPALFAATLSSFSNHGCALGRGHSLAIVDFGLPSSTPRLWLIDVDEERVAAPLYVAHGKGSDPADSGTAVLFGDDDGAHMTALGAYRGVTFYTGIHGRSLRLAGLDSTDRLAFRRHVVLHTSAGTGPDYVSPSWLAEHGKLGLSEGCFVVMAADFDRVAHALAHGGFYAGRSM